MVPFTLKSESYKKVIREMIKYENDLINNRLTWLCQIQGFLFAALAVMWDFPDSKYIRYVICLLGVSVATISFFGIDAANAAINTLKNRDIDITKKLDSPDDLDLPVIGLEYYRFRFLFPWVILPQILILAWVFIFFILWNPFSAKCYVLCR